MCVELEQKRDIRDEGSKFHTMRLNKEIRKIYLNHNSKVIMEESLTLVKS